MPNKELIALTQELIKAYSSNPPGREKEVADLIKKRMGKIGLDVRMFEVAHGRPNLLISWKGKGSKKLAIEGHMDTVPAGDGWTHQPFGGEVSGGRIYGRGATDMKGNLASIIIAIENLKKAKWTPKGELIFLACCNEEMGDREGIGMTHMAKQIKPDVLLLSDTTDFDIEVAEKGVLWLDVKSKGKEAHGSMPWEGVNAIKNLGKFLIALDRMQFPANHKILGKSTISINTISGGFKTNVVPGSATASVDIRLVPGDKKEVVMKIISDLIKKLKSEDKTMNIEVKELVYFEPVELDTKSKEVALLSEAVKEALGRAPKMKAEHGSTGSNIFIKQGIKTIVFGIGKPSLSHISDEYVEIEDLEKGVKVYDAFIRKFFA